MIALFAPDDAATALIGSVLAGGLRAGDVVALEGELGAGKTALARAVIRARLGNQELEVPSPTFALVQPYPGIVHADLYRLAHEDELAELGLFDDEDAIVMVEWPERAPSLAGRTGLAIAMSIPPGGSGRRIEIRPEGGRAIADLSKALARWTIVP